MEEIDKRQASKQLDYPDISREKFLELYDKWWNEQFDWRVHLGLIMSPQINADEFINVVRRHLQHNIMREEAMAQMGRFELEYQVKEELLYPFLQPAFKNEDEVVWRTAWFKLTGKFPSDD